MNDDDRVKRIGETLDALKDQTLPPEELASLERELDQYAYVRDPDVVGIEVSTPADFAAFAERLKNRQGTTIPDFEEFHRKKAELDRKLSTPMTVPKRRWFQFSLRWILSWHLPLGVALVLIVAWPDDPEPQPRSAET